MTQAGTCDSRVAGIVAAAGSSTRMGHRNKLLLEVEGEAMVRRVVSVALQGGLDPVVVVTGHDREGVEGVLADLPCDLVHNPNHAEGLHTSVAVGTVHLLRPFSRPSNREPNRRPDREPNRIADPRTQPTAVVVLLADMPFTTPEMLRATVARHRQTEALAVASRYADRQTAPPVLYDRRLFGELAALDAGGGRALLQLHRAHVVHLEWPAEAAWDVDSPQDYELVCARAGRVAPTSTGATSTATSTSTSTSTSGAPASRTR